MRRLLRLVALLPIATAVALFVHAFTGEDHAVAGGHGAALAAVLVLAGIAWTTTLATAAFRERRDGRRLRAILAESLPGDGRAGILALVLALEAILAFAGIEASEGRLLAALHLDPLAVGGLFGLGGIAFGALARAVAAWAARIGIAFAERVDRRLVDAVRTAFEPPRRLAVARVVTRHDRGRAPPRPIPR